MADGIEPDDQELLQRILDARAAEIYTALPGQVVVYYPDSQTADVQPLVRRAIADENDNTVHEDLPEIPNVPILFPRGGGFSVTWPLAAGDCVDLIVQTYAIAQWRQSGEASDPGDLRMHSLGSCFAIPGGAPNSKAIPSTQAGANAYVIEGPEIRLGADATDFVALSSKVIAELNALKSAIAAATCVNGSPLSGFSYHPGSVAATKAKAK